MKMATGEQLKILVKSHYENEENFRTIALQIAAYEANKGNATLARDIRNIIDISSNTNKKQIYLHNDSNGLIDCSISQFRLRDLVVNKEIRNRIDRIIKEYFNRDKLKMHGFENRRKILLSGPPGTGKTMTASVLAFELGLPICTILMDKLVTKYMGETGMKLRQVFDFISEHPGVYIFDEFDAIGSDRNRDNDVGEIRRILNSFLQFIEQDNSESIIIAATNNQSLLDNALFRRFDDVISYELPGKVELKRLIKNRLGSFYNKDINLVGIANEFKLLSQAEIVRVCDDSIKEAILNDKVYVDEDILIQMIKERLGAY